ncbi:hypothetical protein NADFUDRAFT_82936 [Nadsonia fulvescens var. elongata DSM 6958]|uniref:C2H2-type domain-containing protein n=1 Tax=Nadsonia fulvescens var. elongata DSM 6958 TaxID=857566 RepID=A0A1E3PML7_9ASCO|nr:hypothetical protein NADFUDRAFT_82936 [Nadsonia fulvescens var. elongata DSM 6958]
MNAIAAEPDRPDMATLNTPAFHSNTNNNNNNSNNPNTNKNSNINKANNNHIGADNNNKNKSNSNSNSSNHNSRNSNRSTDKSFAAAPSPAVDPQSSPATASLSIANATLNSNPGTNYTSSPDSHNPDPHSTMAESQFQSRPLLSAQSSTPSSSAISQPQSQHQATTPLFLPMQIQSQQPLAMQQRKPSLSAKFRRDSLAHSLGMGGISWGGISVGSWLRDEILQQPLASTPTAPSSTTHDNNYHFGFNGMNNNGLAGGMSNAHNSNNNNSLPFNRNDSLAYLFQTMKSNRGNSISHSLSGSGDNPRMSVSSTSAADIPNFEADFCKDYSCCGLLLPTLHDLSRHYEEVHMEEDIDSHIASTAATSSDNPSSSDSAFNNEMTPISTNESNSNSMDPTHNPNKSTPMKTAPAFTNQITDLAGNNKDIINVNVNVTAESDSNLVNSLINKVQRNNNIVVNGENNISDNGDVKTMPPAELLSSGLTNLLAPSSNTIARENYYSYTSANQPFASPMLPSSSVSASTATLQPQGTLSPKSPFSTTSTMTPSDSTLHIQQSPATSFSPLPVTLPIPTTFSNVSENSILNNIIDYNNQHSRSDEDSNIDNNNNTNHNRDHKNNNDGDIDMDMDMDGNMDVDAELDINANGSSSIGDHNRNQTHHNINNHIHHNDNQHHIIDPLFESHNSMTQYGTSPGHSINGANGGGDGVNFDMNYNINTGHSTTDDVHGFPPEHHQLFAAFSNQDQLQMGSGPRHAGNHMNDPLSIPGDTSYSTDPSNLIYLPNSIIPNSHDTYDNNDEHDNSDKHNNDNDNDHDNQSSPNQKRNNDFNFSNFTIHNSFDSHNIRKQNTAPTPATYSHRPFTCPVVGCDKSYKNHNGLKYHKKHGHQDQLLHQNEDGTYSIIDPSSNQPYNIGDLNALKGVMDKEKPYKCELCGKRYKNFNGLKYHKGHTVH